MSIKRHNKLPSKDAVNILWMKLKPIYNLSHQIGANKTMQITLF